MEDLFFIECGQRRRGVKKTCLVCHSQFISRLNKGKDTCSVACRGIQARRRVDVKCFHCGKEFQKKQSSLKLARHGYHFCSRTCKEAAQSLTGNCADIRPDHFGNGHAYRNSLTKEMREQGCVDCGEKRPYRLVIHHKDGDRTNNSIPNLEVVCFSDHGIRHLSLREGEWVHNPKALTPRDMLKSL